MTKSDDPFLERWSRRKRDVREAEDATRGPNPIPSKSLVGENDPAEAEAPAITEADLPDVDTLDESSDFTVFLQEGVPEALRRKALRRLWRLNPIFANLDGLNDYDEDFTDAATVVAGLKSLYRVGRGMVPEDGEPDAEAATDTNPESDSAPPAARTDDTASELGSEQESKPEPEPDPAPTGPAMAAPRPALDERAPARTKAAARRGRDPLARRWGEIKS